MRIPTARSADAVVVNASRPIPAGPAAPCTTTVRASARGIEVTGAAASAETAAIVSNARRARRGLPAGAASASRASPCRFRTDSIAAHTCTCAATPGRGVTGTQAGGDPAGRRRGANHRRTRCRRCTRQQPHTVQLPSTITAACHPGRDDALAHQYHEHVRSIGAACDATTHRDRHAVMSPHTWLLLGCWSAVVPVAATPSLHDVIRRAACHLARGRGFVPVAGVHAQSVDAHYCTRQYA